jgi:hypothetical protein
MVSLLRRGASKARVAEKLGLSPQTIRHDWRLVLKRLIADRNVDAAAIKARLLEELEEVKAEAWDQWDRSKEDAHKETMVSSLFPGGEQAEGGKDEQGAEDEAISKGPGKIVLSIPPKVTTVREGQCGNPIYLNVIRSCIEQEAELEGLLDRKSQTNVNVGISMDWAAVLEAMGQMGEVDAVEQQVMEGIPIQVGLKELGPAGEGMVPTGAGGEVDTGRDCDEGH